MKWPVLKMSKVNDIILPGVQQDILHELGVVVNFAHRFGNLSYIVDDDDGLGLLWIHGKTIHRADSIVFPERFCPGTTAGSQR